MRTNFDLPYARAKLGDAINHIQKAATASKEAVAAVSDKPTTENEWMDLDLLCGQVKQALADANELFRMRDWKPFEELKGGFGSPFKED